MTRVRPHQPVLESLVTITLVIVMVLSAVTTALPAAAASLPAPANKSAVQAAGCQELFHEDQIPSRVHIDFDDLKDAVIIGDHYKASHGVTFESNSTTRVITYGNRSTDPTTARSAPNVATNDAVFPNTSAHTPLTFYFEKPQAHVGFYMGNGERANLSGAMVAYDAAGNVICQVTNTPVPEAYTEFIGMYDSGGRIAKVTLDYGNTTLNESIDDLYFSADTTSPSGVKPTPTSEPPIFNHKERVGVEIGQSDNQVFQARFTFPPHQMWTVQGGDGKAYTQIAVPGVELRTEPIGQPDLPVYRRLLAVPRGAQVILRTPQIESSLVLSDIVLYPVQPEPVDSGLAQEKHPGDPPHEQPPGDEVFADPDFVVDTKAYDSDALFPAQPVRIEKVGRMRDLDVVLVSVAAGQYNPARNTLHLFRQVSVDIQFEGGEGYFLPGRVRNPFDSPPQVYDLVLNRAILGKFIGELTPMPFPCLGAELLIITDPAFRTAADTLADWKRSKGISTLVMETGSDANDAGTTKEEIQQTIRDKYDNCLVRPSYVDLIGDAEHIPPFYRATAYTDAAGTDLDYSLMDDADIMPDLALGRIPVDTADEAQAVVDKIVNYEKSPPFVPIITSSTFYNTMSFASYFQCCKSDASAGTDARAYVETSEYVRDALTSKYTVERIYTTNADASNTPNYYYNGASLPADLNASSGFAWDGSGDDIVDAFNAGRMLVYHRDHGWSGGWSNPSFSYSRFSDLSNGSKTPVVYSVNCSTGYFDNETDGSGASGSYFAEQLLRLSDGGAVGVIAATRVSPTWANNALTRGLFDATWTDVVSDYGDSTSITRLGDILNYGKAYLVGQVGVTQTAGSVSQNTADTDVIIFHVFGDATMEMWTGNPYIIRLPWEAIPIRVGPRVWKFKYPVEGAVITALQGGKPLARGTVVKGEAMLRLITERDPKQPIHFSADLPGAIATPLRVKQISGAVTQEQGGKVESEDGDFSVEFPPNAVDRRVEIVHTTLVSPTVKVPTGKRSFRSFLIDAFDENGVEVKKFKDFYVMKICFSDEEAAQLGLGTGDSHVELAFYDVEKQEWVSVPTKVDAGGKCIVARIDHFTEFAVLVEDTGHSLFLPAVTSQ